MPRLALVAAVLALAGCGGSTHPQSPSFGSPEADFVSALLLHDTAHARSLILPGLDRAESVDQLVATLEQYGVPTHPIRSTLHHDCRPPITVVGGGGGMTWGRTCSTFWIGDSHTAQAVIQVWLTTRRNRVAAFSLRASRPRATSRRSAPPHMRPCGTLSVGIGWHLAATPNVTCPAARRLIATYLERGGNRRATRVVQNYVCARRDLSDAEHIRCALSARLVTAKSFGY